MRVHMEDPSAWMSARRARHGHTIRQSPVASSSLCQSGASRARQTPNPQAVLDRTLDHYSCPTGWRAPASTTAHRSPGRARGPVDGDDCAPIAACRCGSAVSRVDGSEVHRGRIGRAASTIGQTCASDPKAKTCARGSPIASDRVLTAAGAAQKVHPRLQRHTREWTMRASPRPEEIDPGQPRHSASGPTQPRFVRSRYVLETPAAISPGTTSTS